jgi:cell wall-associated NlpC family hydrolase
LLRYALSESRKGIKPQELGNTTFDGIVIKVQQDTNGVYGLAGGQIIDVSIENKGHEIHKNIPVVYAGMWGMFGIVSVGDKVRIITLSSMDGGEGSRSINSTRLVALGSRLSPGEMAKQFATGVIGGITSGLSSVGASIAGILNSASPMGAKVVELARSQMGKPYIWGAESPEIGFDCSGLVYWIYQQLGLSLPRVADEQSKVGTPIPRELLQPGDRLYLNRKNGVWGHTAIYIGNNQYIHAPRPGQYITIGTLGPNTTFAARR